MLKKKIKRTIRFGPMDQLYGVITTHFDSLGVSKSALILIPNGSQETQRKKVGERQWESEGSDKQRTSPILSPPTKNERKEGESRKPTVGERHPLESHNETLDLIARSVILKQRENKVGR